MKLQGLDQLKQNLRESQLLMQTIPEKLASIKEDPEPNPTPLEVDEAGTLWVRKRVKVVIQCDPLARIKDYIHKSNSKDEINPKEETKPKDEIKVENCEPVSCILNPENLNLLDGLKVLTRIGRHFYPGRARAVEPPFIFAVRYSSFSSMWQTVIYNIKHIKYSNYLIF